MRFAWWGAEESGLVGSTRYVTGLTDEERSRIALYLNFDMVGLAEPVFFVYDGDDSDATGAGPGPERLGPHREDLRGLLRASGTCRSRAPTSTAAPTTGRSSRPASRRVACSPVPRASRPPQEAAIWGGTAGQPYDPCYHQACDTLANVDLHALDVNSDAMGFAILQYAHEHLRHQRHPGQGRLPAGQPDAPPGALRRSARAPTGDAHGPGGRRPHGHTGW